MLANLLIDYGITAWAILVPIVIFSVKPDTKTIIKSGRLLFLAALGGALSAYIKHLRVIENPRLAVSGTCWIDTSLDVLNMVLIAVLYIGLWEFVWRCVYRQWERPILKNLKYEITSNVFVAIFALFAVTLALGVIGCKICVLGVFLAAQWPVATLYQILHPMVC
ncbi:MAG: hypothetical protein EBQ96_08670 [Proteobacteria bacterium]|nr:hypothetical protein [Pseudomonadota bacterium]